MNPPPFVIATSVARQPRVARSPSRNSRHVYFAFLLSLFGLLLLPACRSAESGASTTALPFETIARECDAWLGDGTDPPPPAILLLTEPAGVDQVAPYLPEATVQQLWALDYDEDFVLIAFFGLQPQILRSCGLEQIELELGGEHEIRIEQFEITGYATLVATLTRMDD